MIETGTPGSVQLDRPNKTDLYLATIDARKLGPFGLMIRNGLAVCPICCLKLIVSIKDLVEL